MSVSSGERLFLQGKLRQQEQFDIEDKMRLASMFENYRMSGLPSGKDELHRYICRIAKFVSWVGPAYIVDSMRSGWSMPELQTLSEPSFQDYLDRMRCTGDNIVKVLNAPTPSGDPIAAELETKVYDYLRRYVEGLCPEKSGEFLRFVTGHEVVTGKISIEFNSNTNFEMMLPIGHTCGMVIELSRFTGSFSDLELLITNALNNKDASTRYHQA